MLLLIQQKYKHVEMKLFVFKVDNFFFQRKGKNTIQLDSFLLIIVILFRNFLFFFLWSYFSELHVFRVAILHKILEDDSENRVNKNFRRTFNSWFFFNFYFRSVWPTSNSLLSPGVPEVISEVFICSTSRERGTAFDFL